MGDLVIGGKTMDEWESEWVRAPGGFKTSHPELHGDVGLYRAVLNGVVVFIGRATQFMAAGLFTRIQDFRNKPSSGTDHFGAREILARVDDLELEVLVTGRGWKCAELAVQLRPKMIRRHNPRWNMCKPRQ